MFIDGEISWVSGWVTVFSSNNMLGPRRPKNIKFGTKVVSSTWMTCALEIFGKSFQYAAKFAKKTAKKQAKNGK